MRFTLNDFLLSVLLLAGTSPTAMAAKINFTETQADSVKCRNVDGVPSCEVETSGKYTATAVLPASTLLDHGISSYQIDLNTYIAFTIGDFTFSGTIGEAVKYSLRSATWKLTHEVCNANGVCKYPADTTISSKIGLRGVSIKATGVSKISTDVSFGSGVFASLCLANGDGHPFSEPVEMTVDSEVFTATVNGTCSVKTKTKVKNGESFDLNLVTVKATIDILL